MAEYFFWDFKTCSMDVASFDSFFKDIEEN